MEKINHIVLSLLLLLSTNVVLAQESISEIENKLLDLEQSRVELLKELEQLRLSKIIADLEVVGLPISEGEVQVVRHKAMVLGYSEKHEQAAWVSHIVIPEIETGNVSRTNDFRVDKLVTTGTAEKADYWYSGFDRGHLAPSADFRWSAKALSESYFYSNMAPQKPELNRETWAGLENLIREYVVSNKEQVYVVTGGVLNAELPKMNNEGHKNEVSIPNLFYKVVLDNEGDNKSAIGFVLENKKNDHPILSYAVSVDSVEALTGVDFFTNLPEEEQEKLESSFDLNLWKSEAMKGDVLPIPPAELNKGEYNSVMAQYHIDSKGCVCGTVVSAKHSEKSGATFLNLDKKFPNQLFTISIWKDSRVNFSYLPENELNGKKICVTGLIENKKGTPTMNITNEKNIRIVENNTEE